MIKFGKETVRLTKDIKLTNDVIKGYYLVLPDGSHIWFSKTVDVDAFEKVCDKYLKESDGYQYTVERCDGMLVGTDRLAWSNLDHTNLFV